MNVNVNGRRGGGTADIMHKEAARVPVRGESSLSSPHDVGIYAGSERRGRGELQHDLLAARRATIITKLEMDEPAKLARLRSISSTHNVSENKIHPVPPRGIL